VPLLGAGANLCDRGEGQLFEKGKLLPSGGELAAYLAREYGYPDDDIDLVRISQYIAVEAGEAHLYKELRDLFVQRYAPSGLHRFLAAIPRMMRESGRTPYYQLIVTTNYDDVLEEALRDEGEPFDVVTYVEAEGSFIHCPHGEPATVIEPGRANEYTVAMAEDDDERLERTVVMKIHGAVDRGDPDADSFVITEDDYIEYLTRADISRLVPVNLVTKLKNSHILFLGYSLRDWNLRVILHRIWGEQKLSKKWTPWAIQWQPDPLEKEFWNMRGVRIVDVRLADYVAGLEERMRLTAPTAASS
jgi:hypothetical protein